ncbi:uncharacterized protein TNCV_4618941 [Trichonephila clavipes]|nr:uncharacterized protein TNCV_4618941 [Trichonephila clavipes]
MVGTMTKDEHMQDDFETPEKMIPEHCLEALSFVWGRVFLSWDTYEIRVEERKYTIQTEEYRHLLQGCAASSSRPESIADWNHCVEDVWWPKNRYQQKRRVLSDDETTEDLRGITVPVEYYSRHQLLRGDSPSYILPPSSQNQKGAPVYTYRPGTSNQVSKIWPSRAHDGSMEPKQQDATNHPENPGGAK